MKQVFFALVLLNLAVFVWLAGEDPDVVKGRVQTHDKGSEKLVLLEEYRAEKLRQAKLKAEKAAQERARIEAEKQARIEARKKAAAEAARKKAAQVAAKKKAEQQKAAEAAARKKAEQLKAAQEAAKKKAGQQKAAAAAKKTPTVETSNNCYLVGPFSKKGASAELAGQLRLLGVTKTLEIERKVNDPRYWILVSPINDRKTARAMIAAMKAKGVKDVQLLYNGGKYTVSLGLFQRKEIADLRLKNLTRLGFKPRVSRQDRTLIRYWLTMPEPSPAWTSEQWNQLLASHKNLGYEAGKCPPEFGGAAVTP